MSNLGQLRTDKPPEETRRDIEDVFHKWGIDEYRIPRDGKGDKGDAVIVYWLNDKKQELTCRRFWYYRENLRAPQPSPKRRYGGGLYFDPPERMAAGERDEMNITIRDEPKAVAYLCIDRLTDEGVKRLPIATGFIVQLTALNIRWTYLVTSRHVIENSEEETIFIRVNEIGGVGYRDEPTRRNDWFIHDSADVPTIMFVPKDPQKVDAARIPTEGFVSGGPDDYYYQGPPTAHLQHPVTVGLELFFVGLFSEHPGRDRNLPIVRYGRIA